MYLAENFSFSFGNAIDTSLKAHNTLSFLAYQLNTNQYDTLTIDMHELTFIAANQFAVLGCVFHTYMRQYRESQLTITGMSRKIRTVIQKNGFGRYFNLDSIPDRFHTVIPYKVFLVNETKEFESYLTIQLFSRDDLSEKMKFFSHFIQDYLLEVFINVSNHTSSQYVYSCGQFFPKSSMLYFTIADNGETIPYNVQTYFEKNSINSNCNYLQWALQEGTSTSDSGDSRGVGLFITKEFLLKTQGEIYIISGMDCYEMTVHGERYQKMQYPFPGTIVTLGFNLSDSSFNTIANAPFEEIQF